MKQLQQVLPLFLVIALLAGALFLVRPGGPLMPDPSISGDSADNTPTQDPPKNDPDLDQNGNSTGSLPGNDDTGNENSGNTNTDNSGSGNDSSENNSSENNSSENGSGGDNSSQQQPPAYQYSYDITPYLPAISTSFTNKSDILLVNKQHPLSQSYAPSQLVTLHSGDTLYGKSVQLDSTAAAALKAMLLCMRADGIDDIYVTSGYRSYEYQVTNHKNHIQTEQAGISAEAYAYLGSDYIQKFYISQGKTKLSYEDARAVALSYSAEPGKSEHQSGLCVDFMTKTMSELSNEQFEPTAAYRWLLENACQFGFILRYPEDKTDITGYSYESWHFRFVGREAAIEISQRGITLEEYLSGN